jgi:putative glutamine amidotransferase
MASFKRSRVAAYSGGVTRPLVLVAARWAGVVEGRDRPSVYTPLKVLDAVVRAGGEPILAWPGDQERADALVRHADAVVLQGGDDLDLRPFGVTEVHPREVHAPPAQDAADVTLARAAAAAGRPVLAICRGMQILNVVLGGTLHQHVDETTVPHANNPHDVDVVPGTLLEEVMGGGALSGWSNHHQACDRVADGLVLAATTPDGGIEALESREAGVLAVQWHPEVDASTVPHQQALFDWLVGTARAA